MDYDELAEAGIAALPLLAGWIVWVMCATWPTLRRSGNSPCGPVLASAGVIAYWATQSVVSFPLRSQSQTMFAVAALAVLLLALGLRANMPGNTRYRRIGTSPHDTSSDRLFRWGRAASGLAVLGIGTAIDRQSRPNSELTVRVSGLFRDCAQETVTINATMADNHDLALVAAETLVEGRLNPAGTLFLLALA